MTDTYTLINLDNLRHNAKTLTEKYSEYGTHIGIVKGDAYGKAQQERLAALSGADSSGSHRRRRKARPYSRHTRPRLS